MLWRIRRSPWRIAVQGLALAGMILQPVPMARSYWTDSNADGVKEWVADPDPAVDPGWFEADSDGDLMSNGAEVVYGSDPFRLDSDFDGLTDKDEHDLTPLNDPWSWDSDGDGFSDYDEFYFALQGVPLVVDYAALVAASQPFFSTFDADGDGVHNPEDADPLNNDRDGDGIVNWQDIGHMDDPDNGATPPDMTADSDGDGAPDYSDPFPFGSFVYNGQEYAGSWADADGDGIPDPADALPDDRWNGQPHYAYNGNEYPGPWADRDGDDVPDPADNWPDDPENGLDADLDGLDNYTERTVTHTLPADADSDDDYLTDGEEALVYHTDPLNPRSVQEGQSVLDFAAVGATTDTDGEGIPDAVERHYATTQANPGTWLDPQGDLDSDGVTNLQAYHLGWNLLANLNQYDRDGDGITDAGEDSINAGEVYPGTGLSLLPSTPMDKNLFSDAVGDLDGDGLLNIEEVRMWGTGTSGVIHVLAARGTVAATRRSATFYLNWITDWDAARWRQCVTGVDSGLPPVSSADHAAGQPWPAAYQDSRDLDQNGRPDGYDLWAAATSYSPQGIPVPPAPADLDQDGMSNLWEHRHRLSLRDPADAGPATGVISPAAVSPIDVDGDGLANLAEFQLQTHPRIADTDGDGYKDGYEVLKDSDPLLAADTPLTAVQRQLAAVQALLDQYQALAVTLATLGQRTSLWSQMQAMLDDVDEALDDLPPNGAEPGSLGPVRDAAAGARNSAGDEPASMAVIETRWAESDVREEFRRMHEALWEWSNGGWSQFSASSSPFTSIGAYGRWSTSAGQEGLNVSVPNAMLNCILPSTTSPWVPPGAGGLSAIGSYTEFTGENSSSQPAPPEGEGDEGQTTATYATESYIEHWNGAVREFRIVRTPEGRQDVLLAMKFVKSVGGTDVAPGTPPTSIHELIIEPGATASSTTVEIAAIPASSGQVHTESIAATPKAVIQVEEVGFDGSNYHKLKSDDGGTDYAAPHWVDIDGDGQASSLSVIGERNYPVAFTRNTRPAVSAKFRASSLTPGQTVNIRATSAQGLQIPETAVSVGSGGTVRLPQKTASGNLVNTIEFFNADDDTAFTINWEVNIDNAGWINAGTTKHTVYITMADPIGQANTLRRETLFNLGCRNAKGKGSAAQAVVDAIYGEFKDQNVQRVQWSSGTLDGTAMTYWKTGLHTTTAELLQNGDGQCGSWANLFKDVLSVQGITSEVKKIYPPAAGAFGTAYQAESSQSALGLNQEPVFFVKEWASPGEKPREFPTDPPVHSAFFPTDQTGVPAQGDNDPKISFYENHQIVEFGLKIYDPSYGTAKCNDLKEWEDRSLAGFGISYGQGQSAYGKQFPIPGSNSKTHLWFEKMNTLDTKECTMP